jgi:2-polyprenyl-3-methyl-5-hydroxy-6-metoxy-1,4-benzoquinol methylase
MPDEQFIEFVTDMVRDRAKALVGPRAMRCLLETDLRLYRLESEAAVRYGDGTHVKHRVTGYHNFFVKRIKKNEKVLDVGCGTGVVAQCIAREAGAMVEAVDIIPESIEHAMKEHPHPNVSYRVEDITRRTVTQHYDTVVLSNVLEHLDVRVEFLKRLIKSASADRYLIRVPSIERDWRVAVQRELGIEWRLDQGHLTEYTQEEIECELAAAGLVVISLECRWGEFWIEARAAA